MPFVPEQHRVSSQYVRDTKLREAFQWRETWKCFVLTIIIIIFIFGVLRDPSNVGLSKNNWLEYIYCILGCLFLYIFYIVECRYSEIIWDLAETDLMSISEVSEYIVRLKRAEPRVWWQASCYHFAEPKSPRRNQRQVTRVNMHVARVSFDHRNFGYTDISDYLIFCQKSPLVKIEFSKGFAFARPRHAEEFETVRNEFFSAHEPVDDHIEKKEGLDLAGVEFEDYICAGRFPRFVNTTTYWICSFLLLSWPYRVYVNYNTSYAHYTVTKLFGHVRMIPSYSEAMLMDPAPPAYPVDCGGPAPPYDEATAGPAPAPATSASSASSASSSSSPPPPPPRTVLTVFRTCSPDYAAAGPARYVESGPHAYPPSYEEALGYPLFELTADGDDVAPRPPPRPPQRPPQPPPPPRASAAAITFETSL